MKFFTAGPPFPPPYLYSTLTPLSCRCHDRGVCLPSDVCACSKGYQGVTCGEPSSICLNK